MAIGWDEGPMCLCGLTKGSCIQDCPQYTNGEKFDPSSAPMAELYTKVDELIAQYKAMPPSPERVTFRKEVNKVVVVANKRSLAQNKHEAFKKIWWS